MLADKMTPQKFVNSLQNCATVSVIIKWINYYWQQIIAIDFEFFFRYILLYFYQSLQILTPTGIPSNDWWYNLQSPFITHQYHYGKWSRIVTHLSTDHVRDTLPNIWRDWLPQERLRNREKKIFQLNADILLSQYLTFWPKNQRVCWV